MIHPRFPFRLCAAWLGLMAPVLAAQSAEGGASATVYLQRGWPKQSETNRQIRDINQTFGTGFHTWDDVANLNLGAQVFRPVHPRWSLGFEVDYSRGRIHGAHGVDTAAGPAQLDFEQSYSIYADILGVAEFLPLGRERRWIPFLQIGLGVAYERGATSLRLTNDYLDERLKVQDSGWFPLLTLGGGLDVFLTGQRTWYLEFGASYSWGRLKHSVPAEGSLAPSPTVVADTDSTGPNVWLGLGLRFK
jgi:hypothetical protein